MSELCRILIVDDELLVRQGIKHHLDWEQHGFRIVGEAANGREALELMEPLSPHIVITDIVMPVMDGEEFTRVLKARYPQVEVVVLSSFGEFEYVRSTFQSGVADYILKPKLETEELLQVLQRTARKIPGLAIGETERGGVPLDRLLERLIDGYEPDEGDGRDQRLLEAFPYDRFLLTGTDASEIAGKPEGYLSGLAAGLESRLSELNFPLRIHNIYVEGGGQLLLLLNYPGQHRAEVTDAVCGYALAKAAVMPETTWAIGSEFAGLRDLGNAYREEWLKLLGLRFYFPGKTILQVDELPPATALPTFEMKELMLGIKKGQAEEVFERLRGLAAEAAGSYRQTPFEFKSFLGNAVFHVTIAALEFHREAKELEASKFTYFKMIDEARNVADALQAFHAFLKEAEARVSARVPLPGDGNMKLLLEYIDEHYGEPLSLSSLSRHFHFNPSYLSSYFSTHNDEGFSEYLNRIRIAKAMELLRSDVLPISEIGGQVGYSDPSYFTKVFKKQTGLSPREYRRQQLAKRG
ncbi:response regulator transcription factor [Paenibacillus sp. MBLB2552]|uniref:Response regulator transcription factor n=1 Tax=Paenibacillus mellifer TaxID=2937794 RepID=A0A9X1XZE0_9BACL|nr:response regulator transcription factor [Paenibacillus mellifer]MCK8488755.1 response regulator transcription factor [Paenibacillus mellifer]